MVLTLFLLLAQQQSPQQQQQPQTQQQAQPSQVQTPPQPSVENRRTELNLLGKTDTASGESRRNENVQFNLIDNGALKELNIRVGTSATLIQEFKPERGYFGAEYGGAAAVPIHLAGRARKDFHGVLRATHQNSIFAARAFFQVGGVKPARDNDYGFNLSLPAWHGWRLNVEAGQQKIRGFVNGNVLVPQPDERTPLATDPATRELVARFLGAYPEELPNRTDINPRALNRNSPQSINNNNARFRLDRTFGSKDLVSAMYQFTSQTVDAFQLVKGQNPNTDTKSHRIRLTHTRTWSPQTTTDLSAGFDRVRSLLTADQDAVGMYISISGLTSLGPDVSIPIDRAVNMFRYAGLIRSVQGKHTLTAGFDILRRQLNGRETDTHRGFFSFGNDFGRDAISNLRLGIPTQYIIALGDVHRGFRNWEPMLYVGDTWKATRDLTVTAGLRFQPVTTPTEVNSRNIIPYPCDCNNVAPALGIAYRTNIGVFRANYGTQYGEIFPVTYQQVRFSPPGSTKFAVPAASLINPLSSNNGGAPNFYLLSPDLVVPYAHQYNFIWETKLSRHWNLQAGYIGSRQHKLLVMWYLNRAHPRDGIPLTTATINQRRAKPTEAETRLVVNGSRGYLDAARINLQLVRWRGLTFETSYWFSKSMDLAASYTNTGYDQDSRLSRSQSEYETQRDGRSLSAFDQPHAFLWRGSYEIWRGWTLSSVVLMKSGTPFNVQTGSDGPGFGNVDGNGGDRPNLLDPSILGRTIGDPDTSKALLPRTAFSYIRLGEETGNLGRNVFRKGSIRNVNASLLKTWTVHKDYKVLFSAESINFFNTPQFADPGFELSNPNFAQITNTLNDGRTFRFGVQLQF
jgi:hypothetical protein